MIDILYVLATIAFFWLMLGYVSGCEALGRGAGESDEGGTR